VIGRDRELVAEGGARRDVHEHVVAVAAGGDVEAVEVEVGGLGEAVVEGDDQRVAGGDVPDGGM
jgi:hypothetical protein